MTLLPLRTRKLFPASGLAAALLLSAIVLPVLAPAQIKPPKTASAQPSLEAPPRKRDQPSPAPPSGQAAENAATTTDDQRRIARENEEAARRAQLNLRGQTDATAGESRRNENVNFNPVDNNALRELNFRIGTTATLVEEFDPSRNYYSAEFGTAPSSPIHLAPSRLNGIHGSLFETHNNSVFSARSFFQAGDVKPARENNYGFRFGAPVWKGVHLGMEGMQQKVRGSVNGNVLVPGANERTPLTNDAEIRPIVERILAAYPAELPNRPDIDDRALNTNSPQRINTDRLGATLGQALNGRHRVQARYGLTSQSVKAFQFVAGQNPDSDLRAHTARLTLDSAWSPDTVTQFSLGFDRVRTTLTPEERSPVPTVLIFIIQRLGNGTVPMNRAINDFRYAGLVRQSRGRHRLTAGIDTQRRRFNGSESNDHLGTFHFGSGFGRDAVDNLRMGTPLRFTMTVGDSNRAFRNWDLGFHLGDKWQASRNLTVNAGIRYEPMTRPVEVYGRDVVPFDCDCNNVAPSLGFAYRLPGAFGVVRAAYGLYYGQIFPATYGQVRFNPPGNYSVAVDTPNMARPLAGGTSGGPGGRSGLTVITPDLAAPYSHQYNFSWEPGAWNKVRLQLGYVGSRTHKLFATWISNRAVPVPGIPQTTTTVNQRRPDPNHFAIARVLNGSRAYFDAARITLLVPRVRGWSFDASYWFSKAMDLGSDYSATGFGGVSGMQTDQVVHADLKGVSNFNQPHALLTRGSWDVPSPAQNGWVRRIFGSWKLSGVMLLKSGTPFSVFVGSDAPGFGNVDGESGDRVHLVDPSVLGRTVGDPDTSTELLPRSAFRFMSPTEFRGNIGRNTFRKGKIANVNAAVSRSWTVGSEKHLTFRAESINFFNTPQFADPERNFTSKTFARIANTLNDGRAFQFTLRFDF